MSDDTKDQVVDSPQYSDDDELEFIENHNSQYADNAADLDSIYYPWK